MRRLLLLLPALSLAAPAQTDPAALAARKWRQANEKAIVSEFLPLLARPNLASDSDGIRRNAEAVSALLARRHVATRLLEVPGVPPVVFGELRTSGATRTVTFYAHYDGQPLDTKEWASPSWQPVLRNRRLEDGGDLVSLLPSGPVNPEWRI